MPTFAFWNVNANVSPEMIATFAHEQDADVLILAENGIDIFRLQRALNNRSEHLYFADPGNSDRLTILTRFQSDPQCLVRDGMGVAIRHYQLPLGASFLVVGVHLSSKLWNKTEDQVFVAIELAREIREAEGNVGHSRTIVIGDFNMNPFESGVVGSGGLHGVMDRRIALRGSRTVRGNEHMFFYNPMWSNLGDGNGSPAGTYFYDTGSDVNYFWNTFDQVLVRPALLDSLPADGVRVITRIGDFSLLTDRGRPSKTAASDHLPIVCRLDEIREGADVIAESMG